MRGAKDCCLVVHRILSIKHPIRIRTNVIHGGRWCGNIHVYLLRFLRNLHIVSRYIRDVILRLLGLRRLLVLRHWRLLLWLRLRLLGLESTAFFGRFSNSRCTGENQTVLPAPLMLVVNNGVVAILIRDDVIYPNRDNIIRLHNKANETWGTGLVPRQRNTSGGTGTNNQDSPVLLDCDCT